VVWLSKVRGLARQKERSLSKEREMAQYGEMGYTLTVYVARILENRDVEQDNESRMRSVDGTSIFSERPNGAMENSSTSNPSKPMSRHRERRG